MVRFVCALLLIACPATAFIPLIDGGKGMPKLYDGWFNDQLSKQAASAVSRVSSASDAVPSKSSRWHARCVFGLMHGHASTDRIPVASHQ